jgi:hypothetical protein
MYAKKKIGKRKRLHAKAIASRNALLVFRYFKQKSLSISSLIKLKFNYRIAIILFTFGLFSFGVLTSISNIYKTETNLNINYQSASVLGINPTVGKTQNDATPKYKGKDLRTYVLDEYFKSRNSPLYGQANLFVEACDKYKAPKDCITTVAIARHETDLCKYHNSYEMNNCMGWGGGGQYRMKFSSMQAHIDTATRVLVQGYGVDAMLNPRLMEKVFCGPQDECIGWGNRVIVLMNEIDSFSESLGVGKLSELR